MVNPMVKSIVKPILKPTVNPIIDFLKEMEAWAEKWSQKRDPKWTKTGPPLGSPDAQKHKEIKWFWSFLSSRGCPVLDTFLRHFGVNSGTPEFRNLSGFNRF